ncbi:hypothetical protein SAY87_002174 [Trapa incisa]|uniref:Uncharacterized protein n=1 Tax=Trapa incisa TaxID=236973 RepID=A0AAN7PYW0_9MYRT|nr:hypothetical protein SAY87_002174 [Trapa incisa]
MGKASPQHPIVRFGVRSEAKLPPGNPIIRLSSSGEPFVVASVDGKLILLAEGYLDLLPLGEHNPGLGQDQGPDQGEDHDQEAVADQDPEVMEGNVFNPSPSYSEVISMVTPSKAEEQPGFSNYMLQTVVLLQRTMAMCMCFMFQINT